MINSVSPINVSGGSSAEIYSDKGNDNYGIGENLVFNAHSTDNIAIGKDALNSTGNAALYNIAIGSDALTANATGDGNVGIGFNAGKALTVGGCNTLMGYNVMDAATTATNNTAIGYAAMGTVPAAQAVTKCVAIGGYALVGTAATTTGIDNTIAIGYEALSGLTTGAGNTAIGHQALKTHTTGSNNTVMGYQAMDDTDDDANTLSSSDCTFIGKGAGGGAWDNGPCSRNTSLGSGSMAGNLDSAVDNTAIGSTALSALTSGINNTAVGSVSGGGITSGSYNTAMGKGALASACADANVALGYASAIATTGANNVSIGYASMLTATAVDRCISIGYEALELANTNTSDGTVAIGYKAGESYNPAADAVGGTTLVGYNCGNDDGNAAHGLTTGIKNTAVGYEALGANANGALTGSGNTVMGYRAGYGLHTGASYNTLIGTEAGDAITVATYCVAVGNQAGGNQTTGSQNVYVGHNTGLGVDGAGAHNTFIGDNADGVNTHYQCAIGKGAETQNKYEVRIGAFGGFQFFSGEFEATVTDATEFNVADTNYMFKIPAFAYIKSISATCLNLHGDSTADFMIVRSVDPSAGDEDLLSEGTSGWIELLGAGADGTINTGNLSSGGAHDLEAGSTSGNLKQVWYNEKVSNLNTANHATELADSYIWLLNAGTGNADNNHTTKAKWRVCVEFIGQD